MVTLPVCARKPKRERMMKVYANAFRLKCTGPLTLEDVFTEFARDEIHEFTHAERKRVLALERFGKLFCGCVLSNRDQDSYLTLETGRNGKLFAKRRKMDGGPAVDFSFFVFSAAKANGIFTQYIGSGGLTQFTNMLRNRFQVVLDNARDTALEEIGDGDDHDASAVKKRFRGGLSANPLVTTPDFEKEVKRLLDFSRFDYVAPRVDQPWFRSIKPDIDYARTSVFFKKATQTRMRDIRSEIVSFVTGDGVESGTLYGHNSSGDDDHVTIHPEHFCMASYAYRDIATDEIQLSGFAQQGVIRKLTTLAHSHPALFGKP
jgi:hypothetical protein